MQNGRLIAGAACAIAVSGCSAGADKTAAESGVAQFRQQLTAGQYREIYAGAAPEFRQTASEEAGVRFLRMVNERLGQAQQADQTGWRVNFTSQGNVVNLGYIYAVRPRTRHGEFRVSSQWRAGAAHGISHQFDGPAERRFTVRRARSRPNARRAYTLKRNSRTSPSWTT